jgi:hypothetical protein
MNGNAALFIVRLFEKTLKLCKTQKDFDKVECQLSMGDVFRMMEISKASGRIQVLLKPTGNSMTWFWLMQSRNRPFIQGNERLEKCSRNILRDFEVL